MVNVKKILFFVLGFFFLDILTKQLVKIFSWNTSGHFLDITYTTNTGSLFSLFAGSSFINILFILLSFVVIGILIYFIKQEKNPSQQIAYGIIVAGVLGNLFDRIFFGAVIDWINFHFWPVFNVADSCIFLGIVISIILLFKEKK